MMKSCVFTGFKYTIILSEVTIFTVVDQNDTMEGTGSVTIK